MKIKKYCILLVSVLILGSLAGCSTRRPPRFSHVRKNVVVEKDLKIRVDGQQGYIDRSNLRQGLVMRMVTEKSPIMLHIHRDVPREDFDELLSELRSAGFRDMKFSAYRD